MDTQMFALNMCHSQAMPKFCPQYLNLRISVPQVYSSTHDYSQYCNAFKVTGKQTLTVTGTLHFGFFCIIINHIPIFQQIVA